MTRVLWHALREAREVKALAYHFHDPELMLVGFALKFQGNRVFYDVHEDVPRQLLDKRWVAPWLRKTLAYLVEGLEWLAARSFDGVIAATPAIARRFPARNTVTVQNYPITGELAPVSDDEIPHHRRAPRIAYIGGIQLVRGAREMIEAVGLLSPATQATLVLAGEVYPAGLLDELRDLPGWKSVEFLGVCSRAQVSAELATARMGLVLFHPLRNHVDAQPNKLFEYMSAGLPVVASNFPLWREIVTVGGCGILVDPCNPGEIAEAIRWLLEHPTEAQAMGQRGRLAVEDRFNWSNEAKKLLRFYKERTA
jgi:glycosyltransferase involved in cell wall biosynthesis